MSAAYGHEPRPEPRYYCGFCGRQLTQDATEPSGWAHVPTIADQRRQYRERDARAARERAAAATPYTGTEMVCQAKVYQSHGMSFTYSPCQKRATKVRDGHPCCGTHARAQEVVWQR
jgi:hypothetical protein